VDTFPEYRVGVAIDTSRDAKSSGNFYGDVQRIGQLVRDAIVSGTLNHSDSVAPLKAIIAPGMNVLIKPNWVNNRNFSGRTTDSLITHPKFLLAVLAEVFKVSPGKVVIGDAPIQECDITALVSDELQKKVFSMATCPVEFRDFRRTVLDPGQMSQKEDISPLERYVLFDIGSDSLLEPVSVPDGRFRVTRYDPGLLGKRHCRGRHQYLLCREAFEADVVINLPKLKTHRKAGITGALKNLVGLNGNKEFLPHHRTGGSAGKGDCYPGWAPLKMMAEYCLDEANRRIGTQAYSMWLSRAERLRALHGRFGNTEIEGGWHGNDTVWRMVLDLNRLFLYGSADATLSEQRQRRCYSLTDALVAGEGEGPLAPRPVSLGAVTFSSSAPFADLAHSALMRFDYRKIPLIREAFGRYRYGLVDALPERFEAVIEGSVFSLAELSHFGMNVSPSRGWAGQIEQDDRRNR
jgi:uncharacterized protein (DUF362 family)